jgi:hypothetical protein
MCLSRRVIWPWMFAARDFSYVVFRMTCFGITFFYVMLFAYIIGSSRVISQDVKPVRCWKLEIWFRAIYPSFIKALRFYIALFLLKALRIHSGSKLLQEAAAPFGSFTLMLAPIATLKSRRNRSSHSSAPFQFPPCGQQ